MEKLTVSFLTLIINVEFLSENNDYTKNISIILVTSITLSNIKLHISRSFFIPFIYLSVV